MIGNDIEITVLAIEGEQIKLGINAPKNVIEKKSIYLFSKKIMKLLKQKPVFWKIYMNISRKNLKISKYVSTHVDIIYTTISSEIDGSLIHYSS